MTIQAIVNKRIKDGSLPASYKLPKLELPECPEGYRVVYVPRGLTLKQWDTLLKKTCRGLWYTDNYNDSLSQGKGWEVHVVYADARPLKTNVTFTATDNHISIETYLALQWQLLENKDEPVDTRTWSWLSQKDNFGLNMSGGAPVGDWLPDFGRVRLGWDRVDYGDGRLGVRPEVRGALETGASLVASSLDSEIVELTKAVKSLDERLGRIFKEVK